MNDGSKARTVEAIAHLGAPEWDRCANPDAARFDPFVSHTFLAILEEAGAVGPGTGWIARHLVIEGVNATLAAAMPCYAKSHSQGEYVFDHGWADAYQRAGGRYYPKLVGAVPFTPVPGRRMLVRDGPESDGLRRALARALAQTCTASRLSSAHVNFIGEADKEALAAEGYLVRTGVQYHWPNRGYRDYADFLDTLSSRKRKTIRKEREAARGAGLDIVQKSGRDITSADWDAMFAFYMDTGSRKWGRPYLNRRVFDLLGERMAERCLLVLASRGGRPIAGALNLIGGDCLYGRYWGAREPLPFLHFELCYHQAMDYAIAHKLARVEAGAQGEHKLLRGYEPVATHSAHFIAEPSFRRAVARYLNEERRHVAHESAMLAALTPYRKGERPDEAEA